MKIKMENREFILIEKMALEGDLKLFNGSLLAATRFLIIIGFFGHNLFKVFNGLPIGVTILLCPVGFFVL